MRLLGWLTALFVLLAGAVALNEADDTGPGAARIGGGDVRLASASLETFEDCAAVEQWFSEASVAARPGDGFAVGGGDEAVAALESDGAAGGASQRSAAAPDATTEDAGYSGTNVQEAAVDEPDVVKTDGRRIVAVVGSTIQVVDARGRRLIATMQLPGDDGGQELLLSGDRLLVIGRSFRPGPEPQPEPGSPTPRPLREAPAGSGTDAVTVEGGRMWNPGEETTTLTAVDLSDGERPQIVGTAELDGGYVSARLVGTTARIVLRQYPQVVEPEAASAEDWLPSISVGGAEPEPLVACDDVSHPAAPSGPGTTTVVTLDVTGSLEPLDSDSVAADAMTVYASTERLYVATQRWDDAGARPGTELHAFDTTAPAGTSYLGSGAVEGWLLNQFSLSEHEGVLRVATTNERDSALTTFGEENGALVPLGHVAGLGPGEQIHAVRYLGDIGFVVTFRQTDPLYTLDLSDPAAPRVLGELKIPGYSAYLHPLGGDRLLGVGQDATDEGRTLGTQVSLFDVADLAAPARIATLGVRDSHSPVEHDHKAFLWWADAQTAVVPLETYDPQGREDYPWTGSLVVGVEGDQLVERGRVTHVGRPGWTNEWPPMVTRSMVVDDRLWTLSEAGLLASDLGSLADDVWVPFTR